MAKKDIDWSNIGFGYIKTDYRYVSNFKDGSWDEGALITDDTITLSECACVLQWSSPRRSWYMTELQRTRPQPTIMFRIGIISKT